MAEPAKQPRKRFASQEAWRAWLHDNHADVDGVWLQFAKKDSGVKSVTYAEALDVALCYGWIDGQSKRFDERFYLQRFTPRRKRSVWSKRNTEHVARLVQEGRMQPAGMREVERAQADGRWDAAYEPASTMQVPEALAAALDRSPAAKAAFEALNATNRYAMCWRVNDAKREETRERRVRQFVEMLERGERLH